MDIDKNEESRIPEIVADGILLVIGYFTSISRLPFWLNSIVYGCLGVYYLFLKGLPNSKRIKFLKNTLLSMIAIAIGIGQFYLYFYIIAFFEVQFDFLVLGLFMGIVHGLLVGIALTIYKLVNERDLFKRLLLKKNMPNGNRANRFLRKYGAAIILWFGFLLVAFPLESLFESRQFSRAFSFLGGGMGFIVTVGGAPSLLLRIISWFQPNYLIYIILIPIGLISPILETLLMLRIGRLIRVFEINSQPVG